MCPCLNWSSLLGDELTTYSVVKASQNWRLSMLSSSLGLAIKIPSLVAVAVVSVFAESAKLLMLVTIHLLAHMLLCLRDKFAALQLLLAVLLTPLLTSVTPTNAIILLGLQPLDSVSSTAPPTVVYLRTLFAFLESALRPLVYAKPLRTLVQTAMSLSA